MRTALLHVAHVTQQPYKCVKHVLYDIKAALTKSSHWIKDLGRADHLFIDTLQQLCEHHANSFEIYS